MSKIIGCLWLSHGSVLIRAAGEETEVALKSNRPRGRGLEADPNYRKENEMLRISIKFNLVIQASLGWITALAARWKHR